MKSENSQYIVRKALLKRGVLPLIEQGKSLETIFERLIQNIEAQSDEMLAAIFLYDPIKNDLTVGSAPNLTSIYQKAVNGFVCGPDKPACASAVIHCERVISEDVRVDPLWKDLRDLAVESGFLAVWSQPILSDSGVAQGTVAFYHPKTKLPDQADITVLEASAQIAAEIIAARMSEAKALVATQAPVEISRHQCMVYKGAPELQLPRIAAIIEKKLNEGFRCLYLHNSEMVMALSSALIAIGVDVSKELSAERLIFSSDTPGAGDFNVSEMLTELETALDQSIADGYKGLFATGDMTWELGNEKNFAKLMEYEHRLEKFFRSRHEMHGICQYHDETLPHGALKQGALSHQTFFVNETLSRNNPFFDYSRTTEDSLIIDETLDTIIAELVFVNSK